MQNNRVMLLLGALLTFACVFFMTYHANGNWDFILPFRGKKLLLLLMMAYTIGISTLLFQTLTNNPILTPSILGFDSLYLLVQSILVFIFGGIGFTQLNVAGKFAFETLLMLLGALLLFRTLSKNNSDLARMILVGIIFGGVIEAVATFIAYEFEMMQMLSVWQQGDFSGVLLGRYELLWLTGGLALTAYLIADQLTILGLGETVSVNLGLNRTAVLWVGLVIVALITSLVLVTVGNIPFIGLVVPNIISRLMGDKLRQSLPAVALLGASLVLLCDILGRVIVFPFEIPVSTVFGVLGTVLFLWILLRKPAHVV